MSTSDLRGRFDDDTAQDRLILTTLVDADALLMQALPSAIDDLRGAGRLFSRTAADDLVFGSPRFAQFLDGLKPLIFATAWKVLDLIVELEMSLNTGRTPPPRGWRIREKVQFVSSPLGTAVEPLASYPRFWPRLAKIYSRLEEARNAVVHRQFRRIGNGDLVPYSPRRRPMRRVTTADIDTLAAVSYGLAEEVVSGNPDTRRCAAIASRFDDLRGLTKLAAIGTTRTSEVRIIRVNLTRKGRRLELNLEEVRSHLASQTGFVGFADLEAYSTIDSSVYVARLEDAAKEDVVSFAASKPPSWLKRR